jgi:hypothetical protein
MFMACGAMANAQEYSITVLKGQPGLQDINDKGALLFGPSHAKVIRNGGPPIEIACPGEGPGNNITEAYRINDRGEVVGRCSDIGFRKKNGGAPMTMIEVPSQNFPASVGATIATGISDDGQVVGWLCEFYDPQQNGCSEHGWHLQDKQFRRILPPIPSLPNDGVALHLTGVNRRGQIVGFYFDSYAVDPFRFNRWAFLYDNGVFTLLNPPGDTHTFALDINNDGTVLLFSPRAPVQYNLWDDDRVFPLRLTIPGAVFYDIAGMNDAGQLVGEYRERGGTGCCFLGQPYPIHEHHGYIATPEPVAHVRK